MPSNPYTVADKNADLQITDGTNTIGFSYMEKTTMVEGRGSTFTDNLNSGGTTYKDATPFARFVMDNWIGGLGQGNYNKTFGGTGIGGDDTKYLDADAYTKRTGYLLPGLARNLVYNTITAQKLPVTGGLAPNDGDEWEIPRGIAAINGSTGIANNLVTTSATVAVTKLRILIYLFSPYPTTVTFTVTVATSALPGTILATFTGGIAAPTVPLFTGWQWFELTGSFSFVSGTQYVLTAASNNYRSAIGCYPQTVGSVVDALCLYYQFYNTAATKYYKQWTAPLARMEQVLNGTTYANIAITLTKLFNTAATSTQYLATGSPEVPLSGAYWGSIVFNNKLYVSTVTTDGTAAWSAAAAATNVAPTNALDAGIVMYSPVEWAGKIYSVNKNRDTIQTWTGNFPITGADAAVPITVAGFIGQPNSPITALFVLGGFLYVIKPEGVFQIYRRPELITTTEPPTVNKLVTFPTVHIETGKYFVIHQEMLFCNYLSVVYQCAFNTTTGTQIQVLKPDFQRYRLSYFHYVNGISSDGRDVYVSWNNLGVYSLSGQSWHKMFEHLEGVGVESQSSGLRWLPNPASAPDYLFCGDGNTIIQQPCPNAYGSFTTQIGLDQLNKFSYLITSTWDGDVVEITKYMQSVVLRAIANAYSYKIVAVVPILQGAQLSVSFLESVEKSFTEGLVRDSWALPTAVTGATKVSTTKVTSVGVAIPNTLAPACWVNSDFGNTSYSSEKKAFGTLDTTVTPNTTEILTSPARFTQTAFIIMLWNPTQGQYNTTLQSIPAIDSISVKYLPILDYIPTYQCTIDVSSTIDEVNGVETTATVSAYIEQLRAWSGRHSPVTITFTSAGLTKVVNVLMRDVRFEYDPTVTRDEGGDPIPKRAYLSMIGIDAEYQGT